MAKKTLKLGKELEEDMGQVAAFLSEVSKGLGKMKKAEDTLEVDNTKFKTLGGAGMTRRTC